MVVSVDEMRVVVEVARVVLKDSDVDREDVLEVLVEPVLGLPPSAAWKSAMVSWKAPR